MYMPYLKLDDVFVERVRNKSTEKNLGSSWDSNVDLLNTSQTLLPLCHSDPWQRSGRQAT